MAPLIYPQKHPELKPVKEPGCGYEEGEDVAPPVNTVLPAITGNANVGQTVFCSNGIWDSGTSPSYAYQWQRNGGNIAGATSNTYQLQPADLAANITCEVTATNTLGSTMAEALPIVPGPELAPPVNTVPPVITDDGTPQTGELVSCDTGTWTGTPPITYVYRWQRNGGNITGATNSTYTLQEADEGQNIHCRVGASNAAGGPVYAFSNTIVPQPVAPPSGLPVFLGVGGEPPAEMVFVRTGDALERPNATSFAVRQEDEWRKWYDTTALTTGCLIEGPATNLVDDSRFEGGSVVRVSNRVVPSTSSSTLTTLEGLTVLTGEKGLISNQPMDNRLQNLVLGADTVHNVMWCAKPLEANSTGIGSRFESQSFINNATNNVLWDGSEDRPDISAGNHVIGDWTVSRVFNVTNSAPSGRNFSYRGIENTENLQGALGDDVYGIDFYHFQQGDMPSWLPIRTIGAVKSRNAETLAADLTGGDLSDITISVDVLTALRTVGTQVLSQVDDGTDDNRVVIFRNASGNIICERYVGGVLQGAGIDLGVVGDEVNAYIECHSAGGTFEARLNGGGTVTDNAGSHPTVTAYRIGGSVAGEYGYSVFFGSDGPNGGCKVDAGGLP